MGRGFYDSTGAPKPFGPKPPTKPNPEVPEPSKPKQKINSEMKWDEEDAMRHELCEDEHHNPERWSSKEKNGSRRRRVLNWQLRGSTKSMV